MKNVISLIMWMWGLILFLFLLIIVNILIFLPEKVYDPVVKWLARKFILLLGIRVEVEFKEVLDSKTNYLFLSNHVNMLDPVILYAFVPGFIRGVELSDHFGWPIYGWTLRRMGHIPINGRSAYGAIKSLRSAAELLKNQKSIVILPEGHRTRDGKLASFKRGSFLLAKDAGKALVPVAIKGAYEITHRGSWHITPGKMKLLFGEIIREDEFSALGINKLRDMCRTKISDLIEE